MADKFFLDADTLADLRAQGIVPSPANALRFLRLGAVFFILGIANFLMEILSPAQFSFTGLLTLLITPLVAALLFGFSITKLYVSAMPRTKPLETSPIIVGVAGLIIGLGVSVIGIALVTQSKIVSALVPALYRLHSSPIVLADKLQTILLYTGGACIVLSVLAGGIEILSYHRRNRRVPFGRL